MNDKGRFQVSAVGKAGDREDRAFGGFIVSYSPEYLRFTSNWNALQEIMKVTGGQQLSADTPASEIYNRRQPKESSQPVFDWFLVLLACLIPLDVAARRVQIDWPAVWQALGFGKRADSTETMGALLARKQSVAESLRQRQEEKTLPTSGTSAAYMQGQSTDKAPGKSATPPKPTSSAPPKSDGGDTSTTSRLLDMKRKRQQDGDDK